MVFYGDSITARLLYSVYTEAFVTARFPQMRVRFIHSGWGGDRVNGGAGGTIEQRLERDVFAYRPTVVTILLGMNDGSYQPLQPQTLEKYTQGYRHIIELIRKRLPQARITLLKPSPYDDVTRPPDFEGGYDAVQMRLGDVVEQLAKSEHLDVADLHAPALALLNAVRSLPPREAQMLIPDRVHPSEGIHLVMAEALLKAWHAPSMVTAVAINAATGEIVRAVNTSVHDVARGHALSWTQEDHALPMALDKGPETIPLALHYTDVVNALDQQTLQVTGLNSGRYRLQIDDEIIGWFEARELERGINLGPLSTPMARQSLAVQIEAFKHNNLHVASWRMVQDAYKDDHLPGTRAAAEALQTLELHAIELEHNMAQPKAHRYRLATERTITEGQ